MQNGFSIKDRDFVRQAISRSSVVINLIGTSRETWNFSFEDVHTVFPQMVAEVAAENPLVERLVQFSDIDAAEDHPSRRMRSKALGDKAVRMAFPKATIIRYRNHIFCNPVSSLA